MAMFFASENFLATFKCLPYIPEGGNSAIDDFAEAKEQLAHVVEMLR
jgi:hypothetical protein